MKRQIVMSNVYTSPNGFNKMSSFLTRKNPVTECKIKVTPLSGPHLPPHIFDFVIFWKDCPSNAFEGPERSHMKHK